MRIKNSFRNVAVGLITQLLMVIVGFVSRKVFVDTLGMSLLGINGLYTSILSMLSLTELGIGTAIIVNLYKPLAEGDEPRVTALVQFFARTYRVIGFVVLGLGLAVVPFLNRIVKDSPYQLSYLAVIFLLFLADTVISYFYSHKRSLIFADQRNYIVSIVTTASNFLASLAQIIILLKTQNFIFYLSVKIVLRVAENIILSALADRRYPYIRTRQRLPLDTETRENIISNTKALSLHYVGNYLINGVGTIIITKFLGASASGVYSNYALITTTLRSFLSQFSSGIVASFGNMVAQETRDRSYDVFKKAYFINFVIYNFAAVSLLCLFNPFIKLWIGDKGLLPMTVVLVLVINFYLTGMAEVLGSIRTSAGVFRPDRYLHLALAAIYLVISIVLVGRIGILGVFLGALLCLLIKESTVLPIIVYNFILGQPVGRYYRRFLPCILVTAAAAAGTYLLCGWLAPGAGILPFLLRCGLCVAVPNLLVLLLYGRSEEFKYAWALGWGIIQKMIAKRRAVH